MNGTGGAYLITDTELIVKPNTEETDNDLAIVTGKQIGRAHV